MKDKITGKNFFLLLLTTIFSFSVLPGLAFAEITDIDVTNAVESQILNDPGVNLNNIDVDTQKGIVTLSGTVTNILEKDRAVAVTHTVRGVRSVIDKILLLPAKRFDKDIHEDIKQAMIYDPLSESWDIDVTVTDGKVTLKGTADSWAKRDLIGKIAKGVRGVVSLDNKIDIVYKGNPSDKVIQEMIDRRLFWDALVDDYLIKIKVDNGDVVMTGTVGSVAERIQAYTDAWVAGVKSVDTSGLDAQWWTRDNKLRKDKYKRRTDDEIKQAVTDAFLYDPRVSMFNIRVTSHNGNVSLSGTVDNLLAKRAAANDARNTVGVWKVNNLIKIKTKGLSDNKLAAKIDDALLMDPYINFFDINVAVSNGEVYVTGTVDTNFDKARVDYLASRISGVIGVHNRLLVDDTDVLTYNAYVDPWYTYDYHWYAYPRLIPVKSDWEIAQDIKDELFWSPFIDSEDVTVVVDGGVVTLSGKVDSQAEYSIATENALEGGAIAVDNELEIKNRSANNAGK